jgi:hypothetical protein
VKKSACWLVGCALSYYVHPNVANDPFADYLPLMLASHSCSLSPPKSVTTQIFLYFLACKTDQDRDGMNSMIDWYGASGGSEHSLWFFIALFSHRLAALNCADDDDCFRSRLYMSPCFVRMDEIET